MKNKNRTIPFFNATPPSSKVFCDTCGAAEHKDIAERLDWHQLGKSYWICPMCIAGQLNEFGGYKDE